MSFDFRLTRRCPHLTVGERVILADDRRSLPTSQPVGSLSSVTITANDTTIPPGGLFSAARLTSSRSGPYRVQLKDTDLTVSSNTTTGTVTVPRGSRITTDTIVNQFNALGTTILAQNVNGHLAFTEQDSLGRQSRLKVTGGVVRELGLDFQVQAFGKQLYPSWNFVRRSDPTIDNRFPRFDSPVNGNPVFKVTYSSPVERCRRCQGSSIENDYQIDPRGNYITIENEDLLNQASLKILLTLEGSNPFHTWYGTRLRTRIGQKAASALQALINEEVSRALETLQQQQVSQSRFQTVTFRERLYRIDSVRTLPLANDPTTFIINVSVRNASQEPINLSVLFAVPNTVVLINETDPLSLRSLVAGI